MAIAPDSPRMPRVTIARIMGLDAGLVDRGRPGRGAVGRVAGVRPLSGDGGFPTPPG